jgi:hypothetical protein
VLWYTVFGFLVAPRIGRAVLEAQLAKQLHREVSVAKVRLNPYALSATIEGLLIREPDGAPFVSWRRFHANFQLSSLPLRSFTFREIALDEFYAHVAVKADGTLNFSNILARFAGNADAADAGSSGPPPLRIAQLRITAGRVAYDDHSRARPFSTVAGPINVTLHHFNTDPNNRNPYGFTAATESGETFSWNGYFHLAPIRSAGEFAIENIALRKYAPYYEDRVNLDVLDGRLDVRAAYRVSLTETVTVAQVTNAVVALRDVRTVERGTTNELVVASAFALTGAFVDVVAGIASVESLTVSGAVVHARFADDGTLNFAKLLVPSPSTPPATPAKPATSPVPVATAWIARIARIATPDVAVVFEAPVGFGRLTWANVAVSNVAAQTEPVSLAIGAVAINAPDCRVTITQNLTPKKAEEAEVAGPGDTAPAPAPSRSALPDIRVDVVALTDGAFRFEDTSLTPRAALTVDQMNGRVAGLSSDDDSTADVRFGCRVDERAPIEIAGRVNPLSAQKQTDLTIAFKDVDLVPVGPYSGRYLGHLLAQGALSLDLKYLIEQRKLRAQNVILMDQLTLGEKVDSPDATRLPVGLAIALLKDRNGRIELDVPIEGSLDDPKFRLRKVIVRTLVNLFTRIVTSPFALLGSMFGGGGEELGYQEFAPGSAVLLTLETKKLDVLIKALTERPGLHVEIEGGVEPAKDAEGLKRLKLERRLREMKLKSERQPLPSDVASLDQVSLTAEERIGFLRTLMIEALPAMQAARAARAGGASSRSNVKKLVIDGQPGTSSAKPAAPAEADVVTVPSSRREVYALLPDTMEKLLRGQMMVDATDFGQLAADRAASVRNYLMANGSLTEERVTIKQTAATPPRESGPRALLIPIPIRYFCNMLPKKASGLSGILL